jgi:hypothetical protein
MVPRGITLIQVLIPFCGRLLVRVPVGSVLGYGSSTTRTRPAGAGLLAVAAFKGGKISGGATDAPHPRVAPPPGPAAAVLIPRTPIPGSGCRLLDGWAMAHQSSCRPTTSTHRAGWNARDQLGDIGANTRATHNLSRRDGPGTRMNTSGGKCSAQVTEL